MDAEEHARWNGALWLTAIVLLLFFILLLVLLLRHAEASAEFRLGLVLVALFVSYKRLSKAEHHLRKKYWEQIKREREGNTKN